MFDELIFNDLRSRAQKAGEPPGTAIYTGVESTVAPQVTVVAYDSEHFHEVTGASLAECLPTSDQQFHTTWVHVEGLQDTNLIKQIADHYQLHPLTLEDILNVGQRPKIEEFDNYVFITLRLSHWEEDSLDFSTEQMSLIIGKNFLLTFQERKNPWLNNIRQRLHSSLAPRLRQLDKDYLAYRIIDTIVDNYFLVLENLGDRIQDLEELIIKNPTEKNSHKLYRLKRHVLVIRKTIWPLREVISHLLQIEGDFISSFTRVYLRDVYDHVVQAMDTIETFRDILSSILDIYLSTLSMHMNEVMKVLTIIATIFIPITFITSVYGMNFKYMPELTWAWGYPMAWGVICLVVIAMLSYFKIKRWI